MAAIEWRLDGGSDLGRCCNYEMAVWECKGEDKAIWKGSFGKMNEVLKRRSGRLFKRIEGSSVKKKDKRRSLAVLVIFRCV
jgi:hypothetical protein